MSRMTTSRPETASHIKAVDTAKGDLTMTDNTTITAAVDKAIRATKNADLHAHKAYTQHGHLADMTKLNRLHFKAVCAVISWANSLGFDLPDNAIIDADYFGDHLGLAWAVDALSWRYVGDNTMNSSGYDNGRWDIWNIRRRSDSPYYDI